MGRHCLKSHPVPHLDMPPFADGAVTNREFLRSVFHSMLRARILENKLSSLYKAGKIVGGVYLGRGQEAVSATRKKVVSALGL